MKRITILLFTFFISFGAVAAQGDTTIINFHNNDSLDYYNTFSASNKMPTANVTYRKIFLIFTIGRYNCPAGSTYCGQWDYTLSFYLKNMDTTISNKTIEIGRTITPYAGTGAVFSTAWKHTYYLDVTDYAPILKDSASLQALYSGYSGGFTLSTQLMFIEGTPAKIPVAVTQIYQGSFNYGGTNSIENNLPPTTASIASPSTNAAMHITVTGHGSDNNGCSEFCKKEYKFYVDSALQTTIDFWRICGFADIQAQTGTWIFDRGGWCPGEKVLPFTHIIPNATVGNPFVVNMDMENYTSPNGGASYSIAGNLISYKNPSYTLDASIEDIIVPSIKSDYKKYNSNCTAPQFVFKNTGTTPITTATFEYGFAGQLLSYTWVGNLAFLEQQSITLPSIPWGNLLQDSSTFYVQLKTVNTVIDQDSYNNTYTSLYTKPPTLPGNIIIKLTTNNTAVTSGLPYNETSWQLYNAQGAVVKQRVNNNNSTVYNDTLNLIPGCYQLIVSDTGWADGLSFWLWNNTAQNPGSGSIRLQNASTGLFLSNNVTKFNSKYYSGDFGSKFIYGFKVDFPTGVQEGEVPTTMQLYPNPATNIVQLQLPNSQPAVVKIINSNGQVVLQNKYAVTNNMAAINISLLPSGVYYCIVAQGNSVLQQKLFKE